MMPDRPRIWVIHSLAYVAGMAVSVAVLWLLGRLLVRETDDWVAALGKVLSALFAAGPSGVVAYGLIVTRAVPLHFGARGWVALVALGVLAVLGWGALTAYGVTTAGEGLVVTGVLLFVIGGLACVRLAERAA